MGDPGADDQPDLGEDAPPSQASSAHADRKHDLFGISSWRRNRREADRLRKAEAFETWNAFAEEPGVRLRLRYLPRNRSELVRDDGTVMAEVTDRPGHQTVMVAGRTYSGRLINSPTALGDAWQRRKRNRANVGTLSDAVTEEPILSVSGSHINHKTTSVVHLADGPTFRFPVFGHTTPEHAVMWAVDDSGNRVMMFRKVTWTPELGGNPRTTTEIAVHPDWPITDELLLVIVVARSFLWDFLLDL
jgi:hypothetical protein